MDALVRCIREGRPTAGEAAPTVLVLDDLTVVGGRGVFYKVLQDVCEAVAQQRAQALQVAVLALDHAQGQYQAAGAHNITDGFTDPWGWAALAQQQQQQQQQQQPLPPPPNELELLQAMAAQARDGQAAASNAATSRGGGHCVVIDSLSTLLLRHPRMSVLGVLTALQANPGVSSILATVHTDLHDDQTLSALEALSAATVRLTPPTSTDTDPATRHASIQPLGRMKVSLKRRTGRLRVEWCCYGLAAGADGSSTLQMHPPPPNEARLDAQELVKRALAAGQLPAGYKQQAAATARTSAAAVAMPQQPRVAASNGQAAVSNGSAHSLPSPQQQEQQKVQESEEDALLRKLSSSMRLGLSEQERAARAQVVLPYEHKGQGSLYQTGDFKDYLPPAAGGHARSSSVDVASDSSSSGGAKLGHILYVRDSEGEHDSDEDPDDDLDI